MKRIMNPYNSIKTSENTRFIEKENVFPNPTNGILNVEYINLNGSSTINIYDLKGTTLKSFKIEKEFGFNTYDVSDLSKGVYLIGFGKGQTTQFIVK